MSAHARSCAGFVCRVHVAQLLRMRLLRLRISTCGLVVGFGDLVRNACFQNALASLAHFDMRLGDWVCNARFQNALALLAHGRCPNVILSVVKNLPMAARFA